jgi:hypothetical protein
MCFPFSILLSKNFGISDSQAELAATLRYGSARSFLPRDDGERVWPFGQRVKEQNAGKELLLCDLDSAARERRQL